MSQALIRPTPPALFMPPRQPVKPVTRQLRVVSEYEPNGDQPTAIRELVRGVEAAEQDQVLAPNKTLAAQLYGEMKNFFPDNAVEYFVSYYDYYQPEAYVPRTDTYIEKDAQINE